LLFLVVFQVDLLGIEGVSNEKGEGEEDMGVGIHPLIKVFSSGEEIGYSVSMSRNVFESVVKVLEELHPMGLSTHDFLRLSKVLQVLMVCSNHNWVVGS